MMVLRKAVVNTAHLAYRSLRPLLFRTNAQEAHERTLALLRNADKTDVILMAASIINQATFIRQPVRAGNQLLNQRFILAAGFVKGDGFTSEEEALRAVETGYNIIPGWRTMPRLVGLVEFGSFTRQPRTGNTGTVIWRDTSTRSTQNRIGLKNPGAVAAAEFLRQNIVDLPPQFGINIAVTPGINDDDREIRDICESISAFLSRDVVPNWLTLNISCPNTEDDPHGNQTEAKTHHLCQAVIHHMKNSRYDVPIWVKISPNLSDNQYRALARVFADTGIQAAIATNTLGAPTPDQRQTAGIGGGRLHNHALHAASLLQREVWSHQYPLKIIGCGGILDADSYLRYKAHGIDLVQYWSALVYSGPLAAAIIESQLS